MLATLGWAIAAEVGAAPPSAGASSGNLMELPGVPAAAPAASPTPAAGNSVLPPAPASGPAAIPQSPAQSPARVTLPTALPVASGTDPAITISKNPDIVLIPLRLTNTSLMFSKTDMKVLRPFLDIYDNTAHVEKAKTPASPTEDDDLTSLLQSLRTPEKLNPIVAPAAPPPPPPPLPNLYLGSIVYYSPSHWSVWLDGKKLVNSRNAPKNPLYVSRLSRTQMELVWKPSDPAQVLPVWKARTANGKNPIPRIEVDPHTGTMTVLLHTNQTFVPRTLSIYEGLVRTDPSVFQDQPQSPDNGISPFSLQPRGPRP